MVLPRTSVEIDGILAIGNARQLGEDDEQHQEEHQKGTKEDRKLVVDQHAGEDGLTQVGVGQPGSS